MALSRRVAVTTAAAAVSAPGVLLAAAACALDFEVHDEAERVLPFGLLFGPYVAWGLAWLALRSQPAAAAAPHGQRTRI